MTVWPASFFFLGGFRNMSLATAVHFRFPQPARANQSALCLEHHPSPSHNQLRHEDPFHRCLSGITAWRTASRPVHDRQLTDALTGLRHGDPFHRYLSGITAWRRGLLSALWHGDPAHRYFRGIPVWRRGLLSALWHGNPFHRCLSGILARRSVLLTGLRHGHLAHRCLSGILAEPL